METTLNIKPGYKKTPVGIIPEDWNIMKLKEIGKFYKGKGISKSDLVDDGINAIRYGEIYTDHHFFIKEFYSFINQETADESFKLNQGDILFTGSGETREEIGKSVAFIGNEEVYASGDIIILRPEDDKYDSKFLGFITNHDVFKRQTYKVGQGNSVVHIYSSNIEKTELPIPPLPEQKSIAACLSTWDKGIEKLTALIEAKKQQKKGLMQQLFNGQLTINSEQLSIDNGQLSMNNVQLKRVENEEDGLKGWKEVRLGDIGETFNGLTGKTKDDFGEGKPFVTYLNVFNRNTIDEETNFDFVKIDEGENQTKLKYGDLIFTTSSETPDEVGMSSVILFDSKEDLFLNSFCFGFRLYDFKQLKPKFAAFILRGNDFRSEMYKLAQGSTRFNLSKSGFRKIIIKIPSIQEQTAIAEVLSTADKEIELLEKKLEAMKMQKKGLMQVLLTGEKRLINN
jgi:type I restriction enzyme S subunit